MNIVLTGGGTAGHVTPNIALLPYLSQYGQIHYIATNGMEQRLLSPLVGNQIAQYHTISAVKLKRSLSPQILAIPFKLHASVKQCRSILKAINADVIFGKGGYVSLPVAIAGRQLNIPTIMHESDISMGLANRIARHYCTMISTFADTKGATHMGAIIRQQLYNGSRQRGLATMKYKGNKPILLVMGGSLGAVQLNVLISNCQRLQQQYDIFVITGKGKTIDCDNVHQASFVDNMQDIYAATTIAVTRGGANSLVELVACNIPFVAIPLTKGSRGEQVANSQYFCRQGCGITLDKVTPTMLTQSIDKIQANIDTYKQCCQQTHLDATQDIAKLIVSTAKSAQ